MKRRFEKIGATAALTGSILTGLAASASTLDRVRAIDRAPIATLEAEAPHESPNDSPRNRAGRCLLDASKAAILGVMNSPGTTLQHDQTGNFRDTYLYEPKNSSVILDTSVPGETTLAYSVNVDGDGTNMMSLRGGITLPYDRQSINSGLESLDPNSIPPEQIQHIINFATSGLFQKNHQGLTVAGEPIKKTLSDEQADAVCETAAEFNREFKQEYGS